MDIRRYDNVPQIAIVKWCDYTTGFLLDYQCFKKLYKLTAIDINKQQGLDADYNQYNKLIFWEI